MCSQVAGNKWFLEVSLLKIIKYLLVSINFCLLLYVPYLSLWQHILKSNIEFYWHQELLNCGKLQTKISLWRVKQFLKCISCNFQKILNRNQIEMRKRVLTTVYKSSSSQPLWKLDIPYECSYRVCELQRAEAGSCFITHLLT